MKEAIRGVLNRRAIEKIRRARGPSLRGRVAQLEDRLAALGVEVRTQRLVIEAGGQDRIVAEVQRDVAEVRVDTGSGERHRGSGVVMFAAPASPDLPPSLGVQLWADGDALVEFNAWEDRDGGWRTDASVVPPMNS